MNNQPPRHSVSISGVITDDHGRALLVQRRDNHHWEPPGGVLELGETIPDGLRREIREETGLDIEPDALTGVYKNMPRGIIALVFRCKITGGQLATNNEVTAFRWADESAIRAAHHRGLRRPPPRRAPPGHRARHPPARRNRTCSTEAGGTLRNRVCDALPNCAVFRSRRLRCAPPRPAALAPGCGPGGPTRHGAPGNQAAVTYLPGLSAASEHTAALAILTGHSGALA